MKLDLHVESDTSSSPRAKQLETLFDVPSSVKTERDWSGDVPIEEREWNVGLIVGPSGAGKSLISGQMFELSKELKWAKPSVVDDFKASCSMESISEACQAVGFNTIPAWLRPYDVLSTGEKFRVEMARRMIESDPKKPIVIDEFTSVVDRQVAKIGAHAVQKWARKQKRQFVAVSCHYDIMDWLRPDWVLEPATMEFRWECLQPRPAINVTIGRVSHQAWTLFAPFHYLTKELHKAAACYVLFVDGEPAAFGGVLHRPHPKVKDIRGLSRLVTLPDWQGLGLAFVLTDKLAAAYKTQGYRFRTYPAHPALIRSFDRSPEWALKIKPGATRNSGRANARNSGRADHGGMSREKWLQGSRSNAVFEWAGDALLAEEAAALLG